MRRIIFSALVLSGVIANAQNDYYGRMGLNTETPRATLEVKATSHNKAQGILFPTVTETVKNKWAKDNAKGLVAGTVVWNETKKCLDYFDGTNWICTDGTKKNVHGTDWDGTNSGGGSGSGSGSGTGSLGTSLPAEIVVSNGSHWIASIDDNNYLPFTAPASTDTASWTRRSNPNTTGTPNTTINVQGKIPAAGITVSIPVTVTGTGSYQLPAYSYEISTVAEAWKDNTAKTLVLSWTAQALTSSNKIITATLTVKGATADQNITQLDLREGLGGDYKGILLGQFKMPKDNTEATNSANWTATYDVRVISGIPDKKFGQADRKHEFLYLPVTTRDGKIWLNNNLGANYANLMDTDNFNPAQQAISANDWKAFGSLFQWQRDSDGHELIQRSESRPNGVMSLNLNSRASGWVNVGHDKFIIGEWHWNNENSDTTKWNLWTGKNEDYDTNPCPKGYRVPTYSEFLTAHGQHCDGSNCFIDQEYMLHLPNPGARSYYNGEVSFDSTVKYWTGSPKTGIESSAEGWAFADQWPWTMTTSETWSSRATGHAVRCIKD